MVTRSPIYLALWLYFRIFNLFVAQHLHITAALLSNNLSNTFLFASFTIKALYYKILFSHLTSMRINFHASN